MSIINILAPVFLIILTGVILQKIGFLNLQLIQQTNRLVYWLGLPALLLNKTAASQIIPDSAFRIILILLAGALICIGLGYLISRWLGLPPTAEGAFVQASFRGNLAFVGLPVVSYAVTQISLSTSFADLTDTQLQSLAVVAFAPLVPVYNLAAVLTLSWGNRKQQEGTWQQLGYSVVTNPLILACVVGLGWSTLNFPYPLWLNRTLTTLGNFALPLALLGVGVSLVSRGMQGQILPSMWAAGVKVVAAPLVGWGLGSLLGLSPLERLIALLYLACPTAIASYVMAGQLGCDEHLTSNAIVLSTLLSAVSLSVILALSL
jgi:predicted permease